MSVPTYAYAANNPLKYIDANGLYFTSSSPRAWQSLLRLAANRELGWMIDVMARDPQTEFNLEELTFEECADRGQGSQAHVPFERDALGNRLSVVELSLDYDNEALALKGQPITPFTYDTLLAHELGHAFGMAYGASVDEYWNMGVDAENRLRRPGPYRPDHDLVNGMCNPLPVRRCR